MSGSEKMSRVDRKQAIRLSTSKKSENGITKIISDYTEEKYKLTYSIGKPTTGFFTQFHFHLELWNKEIIVQTEQPSNPTLYNGTPSNTNIYYNKNDGLLYCYNGKEWECLRGRRAGVIPDLMIVNNNNSNIFFVEHKNQQAAGNAHERMCRYFPLISFIQKYSGLNYYPFGAVFTGGICQDPGYVREISNYFWEHPAHRLFWDGNNKEIIIEYFEEIIIPLIG